jgi:nucleotidyltransferase/DNA polymerase involved in DNA repair
MRSILHVDMDQFYAAIEIRDNPALKGKPVVIGADPRGGRGRGVVSTASYEARKFGLHSAMPISQAWKLCPQAVYLPVDMDKYAEVSEEIFAIFEGFTPMVEGLSLDEAFLDVTESRLLFGDAEAIARAIKEKIRSQLSLGASVGIASNKSVAKIASDLKKPDALVVVPFGGEAAFLEPLPLRRLWGIGPKAEEDLVALGMKSIGDLQRYPEGALKARFGEHAQALRELAFGVDSRFILPEHEAKSIGRETTFGRDTLDAKLLRVTLADLSEQVARRLRRYGFRCSQLTLKLRWAGFETHTRQCPLEPASNHGPDILAAAVPMLTKFLRSGERAVRLIGIQAGKLSQEEEGIQESLFGHSSIEKENLDKALDAVQERWGDGTLARASQLGSRLRRRRR